MNFRNIIICEIFILHSLLLKGPLLGSTDTLDTQRKGTTESKKTKTSSTIQTKLNLLSTFDKFSVVRPKIDVVGTRDFSSTICPEYLKTDGQAILFFSDNDHYDYRSLFIVETSKFGFNTKASFSCPRKYIKILTINADWSYCGKQLNKNEVESAKVGLSSLSIGPKISLFKNAITIFTNYTRCDIIHGNKEFIKTIATTSTKFETFELGLQAELYQMDKVGSLQIDLRFIRNNNSLNQITKTDDWGIPVMNIAYVKSFNL